MTIRLTFDNPNAKGLTRIALYRADEGEPINEDITDPPHMDFDGYVTSYNDVSTELGKTYNYRYKVYIPGGEEVWGDTYTATDTTLYGPGGFNKPSYGSETIWFEPESYTGVLPSLSTLLGIANTTSENAYNWTGKWHKVHDKGSIYYIPHMGYLRLSNTDALWNFLKQGATTFEAKGSTFTYVNECPLTVSGTVLDAYASGQAYNPDYPRKSVVTAISTLGSVASQLVGVVFGARPDGKVMVYRNPNPDVIGLSGYDAMTQPLASLTYFWKPILKFIPDEGGHL